MLSEPIMISADTLGILHVSIIIIQFNFLIDSELILITHDDTTSEAYKGLIYLQNGELVYNQLMMTGILGPVAIDKRNRKIFYGIQGSIMMGDINELRHQTVCY